MSHREKFEGTIGRTYNESTPWCPEPKRSGDGSSNLVLLLFDDTGFFHFGCYGSTIETPNVDRLVFDYNIFTDHHVVRST